MRIEGTARIAAPHPRTSADCSQRPPGPRGHRLIGSLREIRRDRLAFVRNAFETYGDLVTFGLGRRAMYLVGNPDDVRHVLSRNADNYRKGIGVEEARPLFGAGLLSSDGAHWQAQRSLLQPAFHPQHLERFAAIVVGAAASTLQRWKSRPESAAAIDLAAEMARLTLGIAGQGLFGADLDGRAARINEDLQTVGDWAMRQMVSLLPIPLFVPTPTNLSVRKAQRRIDAVAREISGLVDQAGNKQEQTFASMLSGLHGIGLPRTEADRRIRDEIVTFLLAGHETTAATVTWAWYLLCTHPQVADRLRDELRRELGDDPPRLQDLVRLPYTRMVVDETMRLYPPVWMITRRAIADDALRGHRIAAGSDVLISIYSIHRQAEFWRNPNAFEPERFDKKLGGHGNAPYWPFGAGPRACVASRFGVVEAMLIIAAIAPRADFRLTSRVVEAEPSLTLRPRGGLLAQIESCETIPAQASVAGDDASSRQAASTASSGITIRNLGEDAAALQR